MRQQRELMSVRRTSRSLTPVIGGVLWFIRFLSRSFWLITACNVSPQALCIFDAFLVFLSPPDLLEHHLHSAPGLQHEQMKLFNNVSTDWLLCKFIKICDYLYCGIYTPTKQTVSTHSNSDIKENNLFTLLCWNSEDFQCRCWGINHCCCCHYQFVLLKVFSRKCKCCSDQRSPSGSCCIDF